MGILRRYILKEFIYYFLICFLSFVIIAVLFSVLTELSILEKENGLKLFIEAVLAGLPLIVEIILPISVLLATNLAFISLNKSFEITAMMAAGVSYLQILSALVGAGLMISFFSYFNQSYLTVWWKADRHLSSDLISQDNTRQLYKGNLLFFSDVSQRRKTIGSARILLLDSDSRLAGINTFENLKLGESGWEIEKAEEWSFAEDKIIRSPTQMTSIDRRIFESLFRKKPSHPKYSNFFDLIAEIRLKRERGMSWDRELSALYQKVSSLFAIWVMILLGLPFSLYSGATANFRTGIVLSLIIGFIFWLSDQILISLNNAGLVIGEISAFGANALFSLIAFILIYLQRRGGVLGGPAS